jgi:hypothetical protein
VSIRRGTSITATSITFLVDGDEAPIVLGDLRRRLVARHPAGDVRLERRPPDGPADRETLVSGHASSGPQPGIDRRVVGAATEHDAADPVAPPDPALRHDLRAPDRIVDALDLPNVGLDARLLQLGDGEAHQVGPHLGVVAPGVPPDALELVRFCRHQQLEQETTTRAVEPLRQLREPRRLASVHGAVAFGVVSHEHLRERRVERLDVRRELRAVLEVELVLPRLLRRHREDHARAFRVTRDLGAELLVDQHSGRRGIDPCVEGSLHALEDHPFRIDDASGIVWTRRPFDTEEPTLERPAMVERKDEEPALVAERHRRLLVVAPWCACYRPAGVTPARSRRRARSTRPARERRRRGTACRRKESRSRTRSGSAPRVPARSPWRGRRRLANPW